MKVIFMGTPEFAVATLDAISQTKHEVVAVVTVPDKPAGRGLKLRPSAVKNYAIAHQIPVLQPEKLKSPEFLEQLQQLNADIFVVVAFRMLPEEVFAMPRFGTFNVHASLLPNYRGAAPIHWAVMNGETRTGVTTFFLNKEIDKGDIIDKIEVPIGDTMTTGELHDQLMSCGAELAVRTLNRIENGTITTISQESVDVSQIKPAPKIFKEDTFIDWNQSTRHIYNQIRGLSPFPGACTHIQNNEGIIENIKIFEAEIGDKSTLPAGTICINPPELLIIFTKDGCIAVKSLQIQGKTRLSTSDFLRGFRYENYILKAF